VQSLAVGPFALVVKFHFWPSMPHMRRKDSDLSDFATSSELGVDFHRQFLTQVTLLREKFQGFRLVR
jgi:hypothetical protein